MWDLSLSTRRLMHGLPFLINVWKDIIFHLCFAKGFLSSYKASLFYFITQERGIYLALDSIVGQNLKRKVFNDLLVSYKRQKWETLYLYRLISKLLSWSNSNFFSNYNMYPTLVCIKTNSKQCLLHACTSWWIPPIHELFCLI